MDLYFKKPSKKTRKAMCNAAKHIDFENSRENVKIAENEICRITGHKYSKIVNSGNSAILTIMSTLDGKILIPDQGGWIGFKRIAEFLGNKPIELSTDYGLINPSVLKDSIRKEKPEALFLTSLAGYTAEQPLTEIFEVCEDENITLVEDASGGVGDVEGKLASGRNSHIIIASTGSPKIVNVGNGGFISTDDEELFENNKILRTLRADPITCAGISEEIKMASHVLSETITACNYLKEELETVFHRDKRGVNVIIPFRNPSKAARILRSKLSVHNGGMISKCPRYDRIKANAVALEIKNLNLKCLTLTHLDFILAVVRENLDN